MSRYGQPDGRHHQRADHRADRARRHLRTMPTVASETAVLLGGGVITTAHLLASALVLLLQHPAQLAALRADSELLAGMLEEALRLEAPVQWEPAPRHQRHNPRRRADTGHFALSSSCTGSWKP